MRKISPEEAVKEYREYLGKVRLCSRRRLMNGNTEYVCVHRKTKNLYWFVSKAAGRRGIYDEYCFATEPRQIHSYIDLIEHLRTAAFAYFGDLNPSNWAKYFEFMLAKPDGDGEILKKQLLSSDPDVIRSASFAVSNSVLKPVAERKAYLAPAYSNIELIKGNTKDIQLGGMFASNSRFLSRAIRIIEGNESDECFCRLLIDEFGSSANGLARQGFILVEKDKPLEQYTTRGVVECPVCHMRYEIVEEYTGWHIPTRIHCEPLGRAGSVG